jgi:hypothetical protein
MRTAIPCIIFVLAIAPANRAADKYDSTAEKYDQIRREHWSFQPLRAGAGETIDQYILAGLEKAGLKSSRPAGRRTLIRRATFDLTGLPPTPEEVEAFVNDSSNKAFEKVIDRLLASPAFGERWGRHWLDVARYAESTGMTRNVPYYYAWRYRDYVIDSFNADKPYDRFIKEQIAGDLLPAQNKSQRDAQAIATGFLALGTRDINERNPLQSTLNLVDEQIDTTTRAFLGMTVACARCHDHKFDPIPTSAYYSMAGIFRSTETLTGLTSWRGPGSFYNPELLLPLSGFTEADKRVAERYDVIAPRPGDDTADAQANRHRQMARQVRQVGEKEVRNVAIGVRDGRLPSDSAIFVRGDVNERGPIVPRGAFPLPGTPSLGEIPKDRSGRLELANWIASERNPLTSRVMVNRIWQHLFGQGFVRTVDNFGTTGETPSHPELLDHLAKQFVTDGWSVKRMIRRVMLSTTYQQAGAFDESKFAIDPDNRFLWRMNPRRLEAEAIRDGMLAASGNLDPKRPAASPVMRTSLAEMIRAQRLGNSPVGDEGNVRSVYLTTLRGTNVGALEVFDIADNTQVTGCRDVTTVAPQALFMMNDSFVIQQSRALAQRIMSERDADRARIDRAYGLALGRVPSDAERQRAIKYVRDFPKGKRNSEVDAWASLCQALFASAEFRYGN